MAGVDNMTTGNAHTLVLAELLMLLLLESSILTKLILISRLAFRGSATSPVITNPGGPTSQGLPVTVTGTVISYTPHS